jgi:PAS domain S-box-containing protein
MSWSFLAVHLNNHYLITKTFLTMNVISKHTNTFADYTGKQLTTDEVLKKITGLAVCVTDKDGVFVEVNEAYTALYGYKEEELVGNHFSMVLPEEHKVYVTQMHNDFIAGQEEMPQEFEVQGKDGELMKIYVEAVRMLRDDEEGGSTKITIIEALNK